MERKVAIVGAGIAGLIACKYFLSKGYKPIVFESKSRLGGVWCKTIETTKLQTVKQFYEFMDFPWPESEETYPNHEEVLAYIESYAQHFDLIRHIAFDTEVVSIDYQGVDEEEIMAWGMWGGTGEVFSNKGKWNLKVENTRTRSSEVHQVDFVILALGLVRDVPYVPEFPTGKGPEVFQGDTIHAQDYADMDYDKARNFIRGKRVAVVGFGKFAVDITAECAAVNGKDRPCTLLFRRKHWFMPETKNWRNLLGYLYTSRFAELLADRPGRGCLHTLLATTLSPLRWLFSFLSESYLKWKFPYKKYGLVPKYHLSEAVTTCKVNIVPEGFFDRVDDGSIKLQKAEEFSFCKEGILVKREPEPVEVDLVIFATGYRGERKVQDIFVSKTFRNLLTGPDSKIAPLYRQCIHPRIPQLAIVGLAGSFSMLFSSEMMCKWVVELLDGTFKLPSVPEMEKCTKEWSEYTKRHGGKTCLPAIHIWYSDQLFKDMGLNPRRKNGFLAELFEPYSPSDYKLS
uniref:Flavin-containing monooxygenase n=1 Tax=Kalanchoe fedtschenkoi TaxID=63787 RepID=A0A7N0UX91_KALFE